MAFKLPDQDDTLKKHADKASFAQTCHQKLPFWRYVSSRRIKTDIWYCFRVIIVPLWCRLPSRLPKLSTDKGRLIWILSLVQKILKIYLVENWAQLTVLGKIRFSLAWDTALWQPLFFGSVSKIYQIISLPYSLLLNKNRMIQLLHNAQEKKEVKNKSQFLLAHRPQLSFYL